MDVDLAVVGEEGDETVKIVKAIDRWLESGTIVGVDSATEFEALDRANEVDSIVLLPSTDGATNDRHIEWILDHHPASSILVIEQSGSEPKSREEPDAVAEFHRLSLPAAEMTPESIADRIVEWYGVGSARTSFDDSSMVFSRAPDAMLVLDDDGMIRAVNEEVDRLFDCPNTPIVGQTFGSLVADGASFDEHWRRFCPGTFDRGTIVLELPTRGKTYVEYSARIDLEPGRHLLILRDVTDRVRSERALDALHETTRRLVDANTKEAICKTAVATAETDLNFPIVGVWLFRPERSTLEPVAVSDQLAGFDGAENAVTTVGPEVPGIWESFKSGNMRISDETSTADDPFVDRAAVSGEMVIPLGGHGILYVGTTSEELFGWTTVRLTQLLAANLTTALDSIDREAELVDRTRALQRQNERLDDVASVLSHDLRNPLNVATGHVDLLKRDGTVPPDQLGPIEDALARMEELISDVLAMARDGAQIVERSPVHLESVVRAAWRTSGIEGASLTIEGDLGTIDADEGRLQTLFENLFRNAIDHGESTAMITVGRLDDGGFYVADDGKGIPDSRTADIFDFGFTTAESGTGIGLSIVETIADAHGWSVTISESAAGGARFDIRSTSEEEPDHGEE